MSIFVGGLLAARAVVQSLGLRSTREAIANLGSDATPDFLQLAIDAAATYVIRYGILFALAFAAAYLFARHRLSDYGFRSVRGDHVLDAVVAAALIIIPAEWIQFVSDRWFRDNKPVMWKLINRVEWDWKFWTYMAVSSYIVVPLVEEVTFRGWMQTRFRFAFGSGTACILTSLIFAVSHTQYIGTNALSVALLIGTLFGAIVIGDLRERSGSLLPPILTHAILNVPSRGFGSLAMIAASIAVLIVLRKRAAVLLRRILDLLVGIRWSEVGWSAAVIVIIALVVLEFRNYAILVAALALAASLLLYNAPPQRSSE